MNRGSEILLVAPHSVNSIRHGVERPADAGTGGLAELLGAKTDVSVLTFARTAPSWETWNTREDDFTRILRDQLGGVRLVVVLQGMADRHGVDICVGLGPDPSELTDHASKVLLRAFNGYEASENFPFTGEPEYTVTSFTQKTGPATAVQVDVAAVHRDFAASAKSGVRAVARFTSALTSLQHHLGSD
ncbi:hypothetical protein ASF30_12695 [Leifsonia sp. Leaf264]|nr:hypothetical protein ASF30_12695 [Leifsonia sp. Leaf264]